MDVPIFARCSARRSLGRRPDSVDVPVLLPRCSPTDSVDVPILFRFFRVLVAILDLGPAVAERDDSVEDKATRGMIYDIRAEVS
jgi:hypothetical protein